MYSSVKIGVFSEQQEKINLFSKLLFPKNDFDANQNMIIAENLSKNDYDKLVRSSIPDKNDLHLIHKQNTNYVMLNTNFNVSYLYYMFKNNLSNYWNILKNVIF